MTTTAEEKLRSDLKAHTYDEVINILVNYAKMQSANMTIDSGTDACAGHGGECGVCISGTWVPCG